MEKKLLINAEETFKEVIKEIRQAEDSIYICMFIWRDDKIGNLVAKELLKAANRGVEVKILKDKAGAVFERVEMKKQSFFHKEPEVGLTVKEWIVSLLYYRDNKRSKEQYINDNLNKMLAHEKITISCEEKRLDHSKFFLFDDQVLILGGFNIGEVSPPTQKKKYADYMVKFRDRELVSHFKGRLKGVRNKRGFSEVEFLFNKKEEDVYEIKPRVLELLDNAKYRVDIEMAYFGDREITEKIIELAHRGVNVTILTSKESNVQQALNRYVLEQIIRAADSKVKVYLSNRMVHSKLVCVDREKFFLGSSNFHKIGLSKLSELNVLIEDCSGIKQKWQKWRKEHMKECTLISQKKRLDYNRLVALTEAALC